MKGEGGIKCVCVCMCVRGRKGVICVCGGGGGGRGGYMGHVYVHAMTMLLLHN